MSIVPSPYNTRESLGLLWRNLVGPSGRNPAGVVFAPRQFTLNPVHAQTRIGFAGDLMMMFGKPLSFGSGVREFFADCAHIVANLEGVITDQRKRGPDQKHGADFPAALATLAAPEKFALSLANNHSGDFGEAACRASASRFAAHGFRVFGLADTPYIDLDHRLRVVTGTQWSNRGGDHLAWLRAPEQHVRATALNLLFPHWGYEMNTWPRSSEVTRASGWLQHFDALIGHHSHTPQPVSVLDTAQGRRLVAWSLGDFCFGLGYRQWPALKHYRWGIVLKMTLGPRRDDPAGRWAIGEVAWEFTECAWQKDTRGFCTDTVAHIPYFPR